MHEIRNEKPHSRVARSGVGNQESVIGTNREAAPGRVGSQRILQNFLDSVNHGRPEVIEVAVIEVTLVEVPRVLTSTTSLDYQLRLS
jgi:hypothetical protein